MNNSSSSQHVSLHIDELITSNNNRQLNWLLSYLDVFILIIMLMLTLMSLNDFKTTKPQVVKVKTVNSPAEIIKPVIVKPTIIIKKAKIIPIPIKIKPTPILVVTNLTTDLNPEKKQLTQRPKQSAEKLLEQQLIKTVANLDISHLISIKVSQGYAQLEIQDKILFKSSEAKLLDNGKKLLEKITRLLDKSLGLIFIEGHTDNQPIKTEKFPSNWELGAARATSVLHYLVSQQIDPTRLRAISYGDTQPIAENSSNEGREKNRRVSLSIKVSKKAY